MVLIDILDKVPMRWSVAMTVVCSIGVLAAAGVRLAAEGALIECVRACGDRLDYYASAECSCLPPPDAPTYAGLGGHP